MVPSSSQRSRTSSEVRSVRLNRFWTETTSTSARAVSSSRDRDVRDSDLADLALGLKILESPHGFLVRHVRIRSMQLVELDRVQSQPAERPLTRLPQVVGIAIGIPLIRTGPHVPALGGDQEVLGIGMQGLGNQLLAHVRAVGVGGVDQVDAQLHRTAENGDRLIVVCRGSPDAFAGDPHRAEPEAADRVLADPQRADRPVGQLDGLGVCHQFRLTGRGLRQTGRIVRCAQPAPLSLILGSLLRDLG